MLDYAALQARIDRVRRKRLFFVAGAFKAGTTWLQILLDAHPDISCRGEGHFANSLAPKLDQAVARHNGEVKFKNDKVFNEIEAYPLVGADHARFLLASSICLSLDAHSRDRDVAVIGEKTPDNIRAMPLLHEMFPNARFVHIVRDGRDAATSGWFHNLRLDQAWTHKKFGSLAGYAATYARTWKTEIGQARAFAAQHPDRYHELRYEALHADSQGVLTRVFQFLAVDAAPAVVAACCQAGAFRRLSGGREIGDEAPASHFRKGVVGDWRNHFDGEAERRFDAEAGALLKSLGYA